MPGRTFDSIILKNGHPLKCLNILKLHFVFLTYLIAEEEYIRLILIEDID